MLTKKPNEEYLKNNLKYLSPSIKKQVEKVDPGDLWTRVIISYSEDNQPLCKLKDGEQEFSITGQSPLQEVKCLYSKIKISDAGALFVYGSGFGYPLFELFKLKQDNTIVFVYEQNIYLFTAMLYYFDLEPLFKTQKIRFFIGEFADFIEDFRKVFFTNVFLYATAPSVVFTPLAKRNFKKDYLRIHNQIFNEIGLNIFYMGNDHYDTLLGFHNMVANIPEVIENPYLSILKNKFTGKPAFIIANGPSLDKNILELKKVQDKGLIISTESAIVPLIKNQIKPDILCILERTKDSYTYHFEGREYPKDVSLLALSLIDKNIFPSFSGPRIPIYRNTESLNRWICSFIGESSSSLDAGANVSHLAFEIAVFMGADPIIFVGQDYAFSPSGISHSKDAVYLTNKGAKALKTIKSKPIVYVEGNDGRQLPSTQLWVDFRQGLEKKIALYPTVKVLNATEGGALINGSEVMALSEAIQLYCHEKIDYRVDEIINQEKFKVDSGKRKEKLKLFIAELNKYTKTYRLLSSIAIKAAIRSKEMIDLIEYNDFSKVLEAAEQAYEENFTDINKFMTDNLHYVFLQQILVVGFHKMNRLGLISSKERMKKVLEIHQELFQRLNIICQSVAVNYEMAAEKLVGILQ